MVTDFTSATPHLILPKKTNELDVRYGVIQKNATFALHF